MSERPRNDDFPSNDPVLKKGGSGEKEIKQITEGEAILRKKPMGKRFAETFVQGEARNAWSYVVFDVLVPAAKDAVSDAFSQGIDRMLFGEARSYSRRGPATSRPNNSYGRASYTNYSAASSQSQRREPERRPEMSRRARSQHDFGEIVLQSRAEAEEVVEMMYELLSRYDEVTVQDLYSMVGISSSFTDEKWGWSNLRGTNVQRARGGGFVLELPRPEPLDR